MPMTKEYADAIKNYMEKLGISKEEAEQLWEDDHEGYESPEMKEMKRKAKQVKRYEKSETPKKKVTREKKADPIKREIIATIANNLSRCWFDELGDDQNEPHLIHVTNPERYIDFFVGSEHYTITLTKHRAPK